MTTIANNLQTVKQRLAQACAQAARPAGAVELLAPYAGQRARVVRLLELSGLRAPRYGPRFVGRSIASM